MVLTKQYLRYVSKSVFGTGIAKANIVVLGLHGTNGRYVAVSSCEHVNIWDIKKKELLTTFPGEDHDVTVLCPSPDKLHLAVGYASGKLRIYNLVTGEISSNFTGHKSAIICLTYDPKGTRLLSGSADTEIVLWDTLNEDGLFRLNGHRAPVTQVAFVNDNVAVSSSKDATTKFWDLQTQHCFNTIASHQSEIWDCSVLNDGHRLVTASKDDLSFWDIAYPGEREFDESPLAKKFKQEDGVESLDSVEDDQGILRCREFGKLRKQAGDRVLAVTRNSTGRYLGVLSRHSKMFEMFLLCTYGESRKRAFKRARKTQGNLDEVDETRTDGEESIILEDRVKRLPPITLNAKIKHFTFDEDPQLGTTVTFQLANNHLQLFALNLDPITKMINPALISEMVLPGHFSDVRTLSFSSDSTTLMSASLDGLSVWNRATGQRIRSMPCEQTFCCFFAPGDKYAIVGTTSGFLLIYDISSSSLIEKIHAHDQCINSMCLYPDNQGFVTGAGDKEVKFWQFELVTKGNELAKQLSLNHDRTLKLAEEALCVKVSPDQKILAVALLDNNMKVYYMDSLRVFHTLYGHKLPVVSMDISSDNSLLISGSADREFRLWVLNFAYSEKKVFAHDHGICCIQFIPDTHMLFTCGKDGLLKQWDADNNCERVQILKGHQAPVWALAVDQSGKYVASASGDKSIRLWERTEEPLVLSEEQEKEREEEDVKAMTSTEDVVIPGETNKEVKNTGKRTLEAISGADKIMEALDIYKEEREKQTAYESLVLAEGEKAAGPRPEPHPMLIALKIEVPERYVLHVIQNVRHNDLEEIILILPFDYIRRFIHVLLTFLKLEWEVEMSCKCLMLMLRVCHGQIMACGDLTLVLDELRTVAGEQIGQVRDVMGFNMAAMAVVQQQLGEREQVSVFREVFGKFKKKQTKREKSEITKQLTYMTL